MNNSETDDAFQSKVLWKQKYMIYFFKVCYERYDNKPLVGSHFSWEWERANLRQVFWTLKS